VQLWLALERIQVAELYLEELEAAALLFFLFLPYALPCVFFFSILFF
jgi:hypothetical protein